MEVGGWYRVGVGGCYGVGYYQMIIIFEDMDVVSVDVQPFMDALAEENEKGEVTHETGGWSQATPTKN